MSVNTELSPKDKKFLDSYDISMFKSAVAYIQNSRHSSCQPLNVPERKSPTVHKYKHLKEVEPPLLPIESRLATLYKKYSSDTQGSKKTQKLELKPKLIEVLENRIGSLFNLEVKGQGKINSLSVDIDGCGDKTRYSRNIRKMQSNSVEEDEHIRILNLQNKILEYESSRRKKIGERRKEQDGLIKEECCGTSETSF